MNKNSFVCYVEQEYGIRSDIPFEKHPEILVFRHKDNKKWFAILMEISQDKLGKKSKQMQWTVGLKCDVMFKDAFLNEKGVYPSYHMNKNHWITVALDEVDTSLLQTLVEMSFDLTMKKYKKRKSA